MAILINGVQVAGVGLPGKDGVDGKDATINGVNALNVTATGGINGQQSGDTYTLDGSGLMEKVSGLQGQLLGFTDENVIGAVDAPSNGGKRVCRFTVGTLKSGWRDNSCDYLCTGANDQVRINEAIQALPETGGEIVILDGTYNITAPIVLNKANSTLRGNGAATILKRMWNSGTMEGIVNVTADNCAVCDLYFNGNKTVYSSHNNYGIYLTDSDNNIITGNTCNSNYEGIYTYLSNSNTVTGNTCNNNSSYGIYVGSSSSNTVTGNTCNNNNYGIYVSGGPSNTVTGNTCNNNNYGIYVSGGPSNTVTGNTCNNNGSYGIYVGSSSSNTVTGNTCNNNNCGICVGGSLSHSNTVTGNTCLRGAGTTSDYISSQYTIKVSGQNNFVSNNNCMGKAPVDEGTGNTLVNNKYE